MKLLGTNVSRGHVRFLVHKRSESEVHAFLLTRDFAVESWEKKNPMSSMLHGQQAATKKLSFQDFTHLPSSWMCEP